LLILFTYLLGAVHQLKNLGKQTLGGMMDKAKHEGTHTACNHATAGVPSIFHGAAWGKCMGIAGDQADKHIGAIKAKLHMK
jgi:hypothetical protein